LGSVGPNTEQASGHPPKKTISTRILALLFCFCTTASLFRALAQAPAIVTQPPLTTTISPGLEYSPTPITIDFTPDQRLAQVVIPVFDDALFESTEAAELNLAIATPSAAGATLGVRSNAQLLIANNDARIPRIGFIGRPGDELARARLRLTGPAGQRIGIEISTDLLNWTPAEDVVIGEDGTRELPIELERLDGSFFRFGPKR
jgi:hypothetical protein